MQFVSIQEDLTKHARTLQAVSWFKEGRYEDALTALSDLDTNPARVMGLYPELIAGRLSVPEEQWIELFEGKRKSPLTGQSPVVQEAEQETKGNKSQDDESSEGLGIKHAFRALEGIIPGLRTATEADEESPQPEEDHLAEEEATREKIKQETDGELIELR